MTATSSPMLLRGKTAIVTGSNRGIGRAIVEVFARNGAGVWACARKPDDAFEQFVRELSEEAGVAVRPVYFDLADATRVRAAVEQIKADKTAVDVLVNNAGVIFTSLFQMTPIDKTKEVFDINLFSQMLLTQYVARIMSRQRSGCIVNVSSSAAIEGNAGRAAYASSKAAVIAFTKVIANELSEHNIRVNAVAPGLTQTDMMTTSTPAAALASTLARTCMKRVGRPEEIANAVLFLSSDLSSYVTGQVLRVDGGM